MKVVIFNGGLGNQIFAYLFSRYLQQRFPDHKVLGAYWSGSLSVHGGLEVDTAFRVVLPPSCWYADLWSKAYRLAKKWGIDGTGSKDGKTGGGKEIAEGLNNVVVGAAGTADNSKNRVADVIGATAEEYSWRGIVYDNYWLDQKYFSHIDLREALPFRTEWLGENNLALGRELAAASSVAVHIRRGDYTNPENYTFFGQYCTLDYYREAIERMQQMLPDARFYFFSDDMDYVRQHLAIPGAQYIAHNRGADNWKDLYLMSCCHHHIIANSTFSYWGARLCQQPSGQIVFSPRKWFYWEEPDIFPSNWIRL